MEVDGCSPEHHVVNGPRMRPRKSENPDPQFGNWITRQQ
jgi:hypothetical protein